MRALLGLALLLSPFAAQPALAAPWTLARSEVMTVAAADGHVYQVMVAWPEGLPPPNGWPVLWVLDGADNFAVAAATARRLARAGARSGIEEGLVVGIESGPLARRVLDYTPRLPGYRIPQGAPAHGLATGGGADFLDFLESEVAPAVAKRWRIDPRRQTLLGHSFGALLALQALFEGRSFAAIVAVSPSLWFGGGALAFDPGRIPAVDGRKVLIAGGDAEGGPDAAAGAAGEALAARLASAGVAARYRELPGFAHGATMLAAMADAVALAFAREPGR